MKTHAVSVPGQWPVERASSAVRSTLPSALPPVRLTLTDEAPPRPKVALTDLPGEILLSAFTQAGPFSAAHLAGLALLGNRRIARVSRDNALWRQAEPPLFVQTAPFRGHRWLHKTFAKRMRWVDGVSEKWARRVRAVFAGDASLQPREYDRLLKRFPHSLDLAYTLLARAPRHFAAASSAVHSNFQVARVTLERYGNGVFSLDPDLRNALDLIVLAARDDEALVSFMGPSLCRNAAAFKALVAASRHALSYAHHSILGNEDLLVELMGINGLALCGLPHGRTHRVIDAALAQAPRALEHVPTRQGHFNTVLPLVRRDGIVLQFAARHLQKNAQVCWAAVAENPKAAAWCYLPHEELVPLFTYAYVRAPDALKEVHPDLRQDYLFHLRTYGSCALGALAVGFAAAGARACGDRSLFTASALAAGIVMGPYGVFEMIHPTSEEAFANATVLAVALVLITPLLT